VEGGEIGNNKFDIIQRAVNAIRDADQQGLLKEGFNKLWVVNMNGHKAQINVFIQNGNFININLFVTDGV
jgi:hypothetical protein